MARAEGQPLHGELRHGRDPDHRAVPSPGDAAAASQAMARASSSTCARKPASAACEALHRGQLDCVLLALPFACGEVDCALLFDDPLFVAFPRGEAPAATIGRGRRHRREPAAAARGRPLPQGPCAVGLQPARASRPCGDDGNVAAHAGADGRQWARPDVRAREWRSRPASSTGPRVEARPLRSELGYRRIALIWRRSSPRESEFQMLAAALRRIARDLRSCRAAAPTSAAGAPRALRHSARDLDGLRTACRSKRSAFMTFVHALTKSRTNFSSLPFSA